MAWRPWEPHGTTFSQTDPAAATLN
jgi:hypothetical protein